MQRVVRAIVGCLLVSAFLYAYAKEDFVLITSLYHEKNEVRAQEYITCMEKNCAHPHIKTIHVMFDTDGDDNEKAILPDYLHHPKIVIEYIKGRPSFGTIFHRAACLYKDSLIIVSNADIYFNTTLYQLDGVDFSNLFLALTRWNITKDNKLVVYTETFVKNYQRITQTVQGSQDVWIFRAPLVGIRADDIYVGLPHCDNYLAYRVMDAGYAVYNPVFSIQCCHLHLSKIRNYVYPGPLSQESAGIPGSRLGDIGNPLYKAAEMPHTKK
jgi:hypothetical protein